MERCGTMPQKDRTMKAIIRKDEEAVSPVIATILMVAITVVLAAVLYVMVSGLITSPGSTPKAIGAGISRSSDGTNWVVTLSSVPTGFSNSTVSLGVVTAAGTPNVTATALSSYAATKTPAVTAGDRITLMITYYASGDQL
jgi:flagellin-like protein